MGALHRAAPYRGPLVDVEALAQRALGAVRARHMSKTYPLAGQLPGLAFFNNVKLYGQGTYPQRLGY